MLGTISANYLHLCILLILAAAELLYVLQELITYAQILFTLNLTLPNREIPWHDAGRQAALEGACQEKKISLTSLPSRGLATVIVRH